LTDIFVARYDKDGLLQWAKRAGGVDGAFEGDGGQAIDALSDGSSVVTGRVIGRATFGPGEDGEVEVTTSGMFVAGYAPDGDLKWARIVRYVEWGDIGGICILAGGACAVTGRFEDTVTFGVGETMETDLVSSGSRDLFVARYGSNGDLTWARRAGGTGSDSGLGVAAGASGAVVLCGYHQDGATFGSGEANETTLATAGPMLVQYDAQGSLDWARTVGAGYTLSRLADGSVVVGGGTTLAAYRPDGSLAWETMVIGSVETLSVEFHADGSVATVGLFYGTATFGENDDRETDLIGHQTYYRAFAARFNADGGF
jgi:hypothetical protein